MTTTNYDGLPPGRRMNARILDKLAGMPAVNADGHPTDEAAKPREQIAPAELLDDAETFPAVPDLSGGMHPNLHQGASAHGAPAQDTRVRPATETIRAVSQRLLASDRPTVPEGFEKPAGY